MRLAFIDIIFESSCTNENTPVLRSMYPHTSLTEVAFWKRSIPLLNIMRGMGRALIIILEKLKYAHFCSSERENSITKWFAQEHD